MALRLWDAKRGSICQLHARSKCSCEVGALILPLRICFLSQRKVCLSSQWTIDSSWIDHFKKGKKRNFIGFYSIQYTIFLVWKSLSLVLCLLFLATHFKSLGTIRTYLFNQKIFISHEITELRERAFNHLLTWVNSIVIHFKKSKINKMVN